MATKIEGLPRGWNKIVRDSRGNAVLFNFSVNDVITKLEDSNLGCYVGDTYSGCIM